MTSAPINEKVVCWLPDYRFAAFVHCLQPNFPSHLQTWQAPTWRWTLAASRTRL